MCGISRGAWRARTTRVRVVHARTRRARATRAHRARTARARARAHTESAKCTLEASAVRGARREGRATGEERRTVRV